MVCQNLVFLFVYQIVSCLSASREVNKHHNSHCLKTSTSDNPHLFGFGIKIHLFISSCDRGIAEWLKAQSIDDYAKDGGPGTV